MSAPLAIVDVANRLTDLPMNQYLYIGGIMRSVAFAVGSVVLLQILADVKRLWPRLILWIASFGAANVTLLTWGRGILMTNSRADIFDALFPALVGIVEVLLFAVLSPSGPYFGLAKENSHRTSARNWGFFASLHAFFAVFLATNRIAMTNVDTDFAPALRPLANEYIDWMKGDRLGASIFAVVLLILAVFIRNLWFQPEDSPSTRRRISIAVCAIIPIIMYGKIMVQAEGQRSRIDEAISALRMNAS